MTPPNARRARIALASVAAAAVAAGAVATTASAQPGPSGKGTIKAQQKRDKLGSHDRELLDAIVGRIVHIEGGRLRAYAGNYSAFETQYAAHREQTRARMIRQQREVERIRSFVERFRAQASKARQAQSRLKWLERLPSIVEMHAEHSFEWAFAAPRKVPRPLVALDSVAAAINEASTVIDNLADAARFDVRSGLILVGVRDEAGQCLYEASASLVSD